MKANVYGEKPYQYAENSIGRVRHRAFVNTYKLCTGDSFEVGSAYSLHHNERGAQRYFPDDWWRETSRAEAVYVSKSTLKSIRKRQVFKSWEN